MAPLINSELLLSTAFLRDMKYFLELPNEVLKEISQSLAGEGSSMDGPPVRDISARLDMSIEGVSGALRFATYVRGRTISQNFDIQGAVDEIVDIASRLEDPIVISETKKNLITEVLGDNGDEHLKVIAKLPEFNDIDGTWNIVPHRNVNGQVINIPILSLNISWYSGQGNEHEAFFHFTDNEWQQFRHEIDLLETERNLLTQEYLQVDGDK